MLNLINSKENDVDVVFLSTNTSATLESVGQDLGGIFAWKEWKKHK